MPFCISALSDRLLRFFQRVFITLVLSIYTDPLKTLTDSYFVKLSELVLSSCHICLQVLEISRVLSILLSFNSMLTDAKI